MLLKAYERKCPYIELTEEGKKKFFPSEAKKLEKEEPKQKLKAKNSENKEKPE
jgi:hypothetical protein